MPSLFLHLGVGKEEKEQWTTQFSPSLLCPESGNLFPWTGSSRQVYSCLYLAQSCQRELKSHWPEGRNDEFDRQEPSSPLVPPAPYTSLSLYGWLSQQSCTPTPQPMGSQEYQEGVRGWLCMTACFRAMRTERTKLTAYSLPHSYPADPWSTTNSVRYKFLSNRFLNICLKSLLSIGKSHLLEYNIPITFLYKSH